MNDDVIANILGRLTAIEARLDRIEASRSSTVTPPPVLPSMISPPFDPAKSEETEYFLGAKVLPRVGALVLVVMFVYFIGIAYDRGWIGPSTIFGSAVGLCAVLIGIGQWKRNDREEFGQILTGIGSAGLFVTFAGGNVFQHIYSGEILLKLFLGWSFFNLAYGFWQRSRAFVAPALQEG